jgi:hypothetical protein
MYAEYDPSMARFQPVKLPESPPKHGVERARASIEEWVASAPLVALVEQFGGAIPDSGIASQLAWLDDFSEEHWDYRKGKERNLALTQDFNQPTEQLILDAADALGLVAGRPPRLDHYHHMLILGGLVRACILRPRLARRLLDEGLQVEEITALGAFRPLRGDEHDLADAAELIACNNEVQAMESGVRRALDLEEPTGVGGEEDKENPNEQWRIATWSERRPPVTVVAAPTTDPARRANTPDSYSYWAHEVAHLAERPGSRVLLVTSAIYVPFQHADAIRMLSLPYGAIVDTIGVDPKTVTEGPLRQEFTPANYLQEIRSTIRALGNLAAALDVV